MILATTSACQKCGYNFERDDLAVLWCRGNVFVTVHLKCPEEADKR